MSGVARLSGRKAPLAVFAASALSLGLIAGAATAANDLDEKRSEKAKVDQRLDDAHDEVLAFNSKIRSATRQVLDARGQLPGARTKLNKAKAKQATSQAADKRAQQELEEAVAAVIRMEQRIERLEARLAQLQLEVGDFARATYQMGPFAELEIVLEAKDPSELTDRLAAIRSVAAANNASLDRMAQKQLEMEQAQIELERLRKVAKEKKAEAEALLAAAEQAAAEAAAAKREVEKLVQQEERALAQARRHRAAVKQQYDRLASEQARLQQQIAKAAARLERQSGLPTGTGNGDWYFPLPGYSIGSDAGWRLHPILGYTRCHAGADVSAPSGTPIRAVDSGVVIQAGWNGGYGNLVTIGHGGGLTSSYAHQSSISVSTGQSVQRGQIIGSVGSTGLSTGPHLHFEARIGGAPYSPRGWFGSGSKSRVCV